MNTYLMCCLCKTRWQLVTRPNLPPAWPADLVIHDVSLLNHSKQCADATFVLIRGKA